VSDYFSLKQFLHLSNNFAAFFGRLLVFEFILLCTFLEVDLVGVFLCNVSENAISGSLSFSNFIRHRLAVRECKQFCLR
jgi:hypothetical protein